MLQTGDVYEVVLPQSFHNQAVVNVYHVKCLTTISGAQAAFQTLADLLKEAFRTNQSNLLSYSSWKATQVSGDGVTYDTTTCRRQGGDVYEGSLTGTLIGGDSTSSGTQSTSGLVVALKTGLSGRSRRGSVYLGGFADGKRDATTIENWTAGLVSSIQADVAALLALIGVPGGSNPNFGWVVWSKFLASGCKYVPGIPKPVYTHVQAGNAAASHADVKSGTPRAAIVPMNRRKPGRGI
jgi:hypothetical protein